MEVNLNTIPVHVRDQCDGYHDSKSNFLCTQIDHSIRQQAPTGNISVHFKGLADQLIEYIKQADAVVGCTAWLTEPSVLQALAKVPCGVSIIVQKEDFLRPDYKSTNHHAKQLRQYYKDLALLPFHWHMAEGYWAEIPGVANKLNIAGWPSTDEAVRCCGNHNNTRVPAHPRMHHKFVVFCRAEDIPTEPYLCPQKRMVPYAVWTGSFNPTYNGGFSLENAIYIEDKAIAEQYCKEWGQVLALSESLDWETAWAAPELRIGT